MIAWCLTAAVLAQQPEAPAAPAIEAACATAVTAGLQYLVAVQGDDGGFPPPPMQAHDRFADTALAGLALAAAGERLDGGSRHPALRRAVRFLQDRVPERGPIRVDRPQPGDWQRFECWYAAFALLLLAEVHAVTPEEGLAETMRRLCLRLAFLQKDGGGWCHDLAPRVREIKGLGRAEYSDDLAAVGALCTAALGTCERAGLTVDATVKQRATQWLLGLHNQDGGTQYGKGHTWTQALLSEPGRTTGWLWTLLPQLGRDDPRCIAAARYLDRTFAELPNSAGHGGKEFLTSHLTGALLCRTWSAAAAARYRAVFALQLLRRQFEGGRFVLGNGAWDTPVNNTAVAVLCLLGGGAALRCSAPLPPRRDAAEGARAALLAQRTAAGNWSGRWGSRAVDLALTGLAVRALMAEDALGGRHAAEPGIAWLCAEVERLSAHDFVDEGRSHLGFQWPQVLRALAASADEPRCRKAAVAVVGEVARSQRDDGGFGYDRGELYTLCVATSGVVIALAEARDAGIAVPAECLARGTGYLLACQGEGGGFRYCPDPSHPILARDRPRYEREEVGRTLGAVAALASAGGNDAAVGRGLGWLQANFAASHVPADDRYLWFTLEAMADARRHCEPALRERFDALLDLRLQERRRPDGAFDWPGMDWSEILGRPAMHRTYATAAGMLLAAGRRTTRT